MKRKIYSELLEWKEKYSTKEALLIYLPLYMTPFL